MYSALCAVCPHVVILIKIRQPWQIIYVHPQVQFSLHLALSGSIFIEAKKKCWSNTVDTRATHIMFISVMNQLDAKNFCFTICLFHASTCFEHMCSSSGGQNCIIQLYHHTYSCDDTRGCIIQFWPPDDEHVGSKHVEAWNKLIVKQKFCASSCLITEILRCTVSKTSKHTMCSA